MAFWWNETEMLPLLMERLAKAGCAITGMEALDEIIEHQLRLRGTLTMHSETVRRNGQRHRLRTRFQRRDARFR